MNTEMVQMMENVASTLEDIRKDMGTVEDHVNVGVFVISYA